MPQAPQTSRGVTWTVEKLQGFAVIGPLQALQRLEAGGAAIEAAVDDILKLYDVHNQLGVLEFHLVPAGTDVGLLHLLKEAVDLF